MADALTAATGGRVSPATPTPVRQAREAVSARLAPGFQIQGAADHQSFTVAPSGASADTTTVTVTEDNAAGILAQLQSMDPSSTVTPTDL